MGFGDTSLFLKIDFVLLIVALVIQILGVALPFWISYDAGKTDVNWGLWRSCYDNGNTDKCWKITGAPDWLEATRAFEILGLLLLVGALVVTALVMFLMDKKILKLVGCILSFCACGFIIVGIIIYGAETAVDEYSGAFAITIIAGIIALVCGVLGLLDWLGKGA